MIIEKITPQTAYMAGRIYEYSWKEGYRGILPKTYLDTLCAERWTGRLVDSPYQDYILKDNGMYVGVSSISPAREEKMSGWGEIISLYVLPACFRKGYGTFLFHYDIKQLSAAGFANIYLWVLEKNHRARAFYEKMGFVPSADRSALHIGDERFTEIRYVNEK